MFPRSWSRCESEAIDGWRERSVDHCVSSKSLRFASCPPLLWRLAAEVDDVPFRQRVLSELKAMVKRMRPIANKYWQVVSPSQLPQFENPASSNRVMAQSLRYG